MTEKAIRIALTTHNLTVDVWESFFVGYTYLPDLMKEEAFPWDTLDWVIHDSNDQVCAYITKSPYTPSLVWVRDVRTIP